MKKYKYNDNFEMLYLRHDYLTKGNKLEGKFVEEYAPIVHTTAKIMYDKLYPNFNKVGFQQEDIIAIANIYMLGYMGLYSLRSNKDAREKFIKGYRKRFGKKPSEKDLYHKDKNNMINFLRQRIQHCSTICARKARNIVVGKDRRGIFAETDKAVAASPESILENYKKLGYRKVTQAEYKKAKKAAKERMEQVVTDQDGFKIIYIEFLNSGISYEDYSLLLEHSRSKYLMNPEAILTSIEEDRELDIFKERFQGMEESKKRRVLRRFIEKNRNNKSLKNELSTARKMLKNYNYVV